VHSRAQHDAIDGQIREVDEPFTLPDGTSLMMPKDPGKWGQRRMALT